MKTMWPVSRRYRDSKGSALVEGALVMSLFVLLSVSVVDLGHFLHQQHALAEQTRGAIREGAVKALTAEQIAAMVVYGKPTVPEGSSAGFQGLRLENVTVRVLDAGTPDQRVVVSIRGLRRRALTPFLASTTGTVGLEMSSPLEIP